MTDVNWELVKFKYEILGQSLEEIAGEYGLSMPLLAFNSKDWNQIPLEEQAKIDLTGIKSLDEVILKIGEKTSSQTKAFTILKQKFLGPKYIELETTLLHKAITMAAELNVNDARGAATLRSLTGVLSELLQLNPLLAPDHEAFEGAGSKEWKVTFVNGGEDTDTD